MNGTSGFQEVRSTDSQLQSYRFLHEQRHQFGTGSWHLFPTHDLIDLSTEISTKQEMVPYTISASISASKREQVSDTFFARHPDLGAFSP